MQKLAKRLSLFMVAVMTLSMMLNFVMVAPAKAATIYPQVQYAQEPQLEYTVGDRVQFNLYTPNYGGRVQYRVVLWQDETKSYKDLWTNTPDRYYDKWMPYGNNIFTLGWVINEPGHYRITIYAKRAGIANNDTYLRGFNCDSYMESDSFVVKAKEVAKPEEKPDIASEKIELTSVTSSAAAINGHISMSAQTIIGKDYELAVKVDKPGVKVMFQLDAPEGSLNKDEVLEAVSGADNIAKVSYKRLYADADYVTAYVAAAPTVRTAMKVYWGVTKILDIAATTEDAANAANGNVKSYKVTLKNPITGEKMRNRELLVLVRENIDAPNNASLSTALITNPYTAYKSTTYQRMNNIVTGGLNQDTVKLVTNDNGEAAFTVTGINTKATPVVFFDDDWFYGNPDDRAWGGLADSSQYKPSYAGNNNDRWDATELQTEPATLTFNASTYTFEQTAISDPYAAVSNYTSGRTYTVKVLDSEGKPYKNGAVNIAINEMIDNIYGTNTNAKIISYGPDATHLTACTPTYQVLTKTGSAGTVSFKIASNKVNDMATPIIWIDQDNASAQDGSRNGILEPADPQKLLSQTTFVESAVKSAAFSATLANDNLEMKADADDNLVSIGGEGVNFNYTVRNQNGANYVMPEGTWANITYTIQNTGNNPLKVYAPMTANGKAGGVTVDNVIVEGSSLTWPITIPTYQTKTISFRAYSPAGNYVQIVADKSASVSVTANANIVQGTNTTGAWLAPATKVASWVTITKVSSYTARTLFSSTVEGYNLAENYVIAKPVTDTAVYVKIPYDLYDKYTVSTTQHQPTLDSNISEFERQITVDDGLTYRFGTAAPDTPDIERIDYISLYNADNSYDSELVPDNPPTKPTDPVLDITTAITTDGSNKVVSFSQKTTLFVATGTDTSSVGYFRFGDKIFNPSAGMDRVAIAQMIANASPITIGGVAFNVKMVEVEVTAAMLGQIPSTLKVVEGDIVPGGLEFTAVREPAKDANGNIIKDANGDPVAPAAIDVWSAFVDTAHTGVEIREMKLGDYLDDVITHEVAAVAEQITLTVNTACPTTKTMKVTVKNGNTVIADALVSLTAGDNAAVVAQKIYDALEYDMAFTQYKIKVDGVKVIITNTIPGTADLNIVLQ